MKLIGDGKYQLGGPNNDSLGLPVSPPKNLPATIKANGYTLLRRTAFHVTLVAIGKIVERYDVAVPDFLSKIAADFLSFTSDNEIKLLQYRNEFRFAQQDDHRSIVVMCDVSNLEKFFTQMNEKYGLCVEYPPTHVTLYTLQPDAGIFLIDAHDIKQLTRPIEIPAFHLD